MPPIRNYIIFLILIYTGLCSCERDETYIVKDSSVMLSASRLKGASGTDLDVYLVRLTPQPGSVISSQEKLNLQVTGLTSFFIRNSKGQLILPVLAELQAYTDINSMEFVLHFRRTGISAGIKRTLIFKNSLFGDKEYQMMLEN